jgi:acyl-homoserine-lactone acylase
MPKLKTREYGANANDSYWISNPRSLTEGFPRVMGEERIEQTIRTRHTFSQAERRLMGQDEYGEAGFNIDNIRQLHYQATNHAADLSAGAIVDICSEVQDWSVYTDDPENAAEACTVLKNWDRRHLLDSVGGHVFHELWQIIKDFEVLWSVPVYLTQPLGTPTSISLESDNVEAIRQALSDAAAKLKAAGIALDARWGDIHYVTKNGTKLGIHGGDGDMMFSNVQAELIESEGYEVQYGNSYIQAVTWDETDCPDAYAILTYSQSTDPASDHYADATELYSNSGWIDMPFCEVDRDAQEIDRAVIEE